MILQKWNFITHEYEPFDSPAVILTLYSEDMGVEVDCANCGMRMTYGSGFTSKKIHSKFGFGYPVCPGCYEVEVRQEREAS